VRTLGWRWIGLGLAGSAATTLAGADLLRGKPITWWFDPDLPLQGLVFFGGIAALCCAWLAIGRRLRSREPDDGAVRRLLLVGLIWCIPLLLGPSLFSRDLYSYLADGTLLHHGLDPYRHAPEALAGIGRGHLLNAVSPTWRHTTAPYGPGFVGLVTLVASLVSSHLIAGALVLRGLSLVGVALLAVYVPRLARALGADPARAVWLAVISPLALLDLVAAGHNDALMAGLLVAGVALALERRMVLGIALCALAATIKLPAALAVLFIAVAWVRAEPERALRIAAWSAAVGLGVLVVVSLASGLGLEWVSGSLSTPARVRLAITPSTSLGYSAAPVLHSFGVRASARSIEGAVGAVSIGVTALLALWLCWRVRLEKLAWYLGVVLLAAVLGGPAAWPWYGIWGLALVACCPQTRRWRWLPLVIAATAFLIRADGQLILPRSTAPVMLALYALAAAALLRQGQGWDPPLPRVPEYAR
jgi:hypothetical protein